MTAQSTVRAFVLMQTDVGAVGAVRDEAAGSEGVAWVQPIAGPYDLVVAVCGDPHAVIPELRRDLAQVGMTRSLTCPTGRS